MVKEGNVFSLKTTVEGSLGTETGYFSMITALADSWDGDDETPGVNSYDRYGAAASDTPVVMNEAMAVTKFAAGVDASAAYSWAIAPGTYTFVFDYAAMTMTVTAESGVEVLSTENNTNAVYFNLQGVRVQNPERGIYIRVNNGKATRVAM
jgi:hypothetical protein